MSTEQCISPGDIFYTQDSIKSTFSDDKSLRETLDDLLKRKIPIGSIPAIRVTFRDGKWWSMDNRRLWIYKQLFEANRCGNIRVRVLHNVSSKEWRRKFTTKNEGVSIRLRGDAGEHVDGGGLSLYEGGAEDEDDGYDSDGSAEFWVF